jgi:hypothetical protein
LGYGVPAAELNRTDFEPWERKTEREKESKREKKGNKDGKEEGK